MAKKVWKALDNLSPSDIKLKDLPRKPDGLYNLKVNEYGQLVKRAGYVEYNTTSIGDSHKIVGMHRYYRQDTSIKEFLVAWNTGIYTLSDTDPYGATLISGTLTADSDTYFTDFLNHFYFVNGVDGVFKGTITDAITGTRTDTVFTRTDEDTWVADTLIDQYMFSYISGAPTVGTWTIITDNDTTTVTTSGTLHIGANRIKISTIKPVGMTVPVAATKNSLIDGELGTGNYKYRITYVDEDGYESNGGASVTIAAEAHALDGIKLNIPKSTVDDDKVVKRRIYRTALDGAIYYYEDEVDNNIATTHDSKIADTALGTELHTNHTAPPTTSHLITKRRNKLYLADADYLYPSHTSDVEYFPATWLIRTGNSQKIKGLLEQLTALPVATEDSIERLVGTDKDNFEFKNSYSTEGCVAMRSYVNCDNLIVYLGYNGINYFDGTTSGIFSEAVNKYIKDNISDTYRHLSCATYFDNKYILCYPNENLTGFDNVPNETIWIDLKNKTYGVYSFDFSCFSLWDKGTDGLQLKGGSNTIGQVYSVFSGLEDDTDAITAYDSPEPFDFGKPELWKQFYNIYIKVRATTASTLTMYYTLDDGTETSNARQVGRSDIAFVEGDGDAADTITTAAGDFTKFVAGDVLVITGTNDNNGTVTIVSVAEKTITLATGTVTTEAEGAAVLTSNLTLTADKTLWYKISLGQGGQRARAIKIRPYVSDKYDFTIMGYAIVYEPEPPEYA